jgi:large subunit ribosomal protein L21
MYAIFESGGKQYRVAPGQVVRVEKLDGPVGQTVEFSQVLLVQGEAGMQIGQPFLPGARVVGHIVEQDRGPKIRIFKMRRRKRYRRTVGHRQWFTGVRIEEIRV